MKPYRKLLAVLGILVIVTGIAGCGGGGTSTSASSQPLPSPGPLPAKVLSWAPPAAYTDSAPLNPVTDLDRFEIYVKESEPFTESDFPMATVSAFDPGTGQVSTSFNLANLGPYLSRGTQYRVSLRAVALTGEKSAFSAAASFSL